MAIFCKPLLLQGKFVYKRIKDIYKRENLYPQKQDPRTQIKPLKPVTPSTSGKRQDKKRHLKLKHAAKQ
jgi:hypothetical protein